MDLKALDVRRQVSWGAELGNLPEDVILASVTLISKQSHLDLPSDHSPRHGDGNPVSPACAGDGRVRVIQANT